MAMPVCPLAVPDSGCLQPSLGVILILNYISFAVCPLTCLTTMAVPLLTNPATSWAGTKASDIPLSFGFCKAELSSLPNISYKSEMNIP